MLRVYRVKKRRLDKPLARKDINEPGSGEASPGFNFFPKGLL